jgi:hypothetical protein
VLFWQYDTGYKDLSDKDPVNPHDPLSYLADFNHPIESFSSSIRPILLIRCNEPCVLFWQYDTGYKDLSDKNLFNPVNPLSYFEQHPTFYVK